MSTTPDKQPALSVVIPTRDRCPVLRHTLAALSAQIDPPTFEVVVIDDGSSDGTAQMLAELKPRVYSMRVAHQKGSGPATARNRGIAIARAPRILLLGDDTWPGPGTLAVHARMGDNNRLGVQGRIDWDPALEVTPVMRFLAPSGPQFYFDGLGDGDAIDYTGVLGSNFSAPRSWFLDEPFDEGFPHACFEDTELAYRWRRHGRNVVFSTEARCWHQHRYDDLAPFLDRQRRAGAAARYAIHRHPALLGRIVCQPTLVGLWHVLRTGVRRLRGSADARDRWDLACRWAFLRGFFAG